MLPETEARAILACGELGMSRRDWMEQAGKMMLEWSRQEVRIRRFRIAQREATRELKVCPRPQDYGLPHDFEQPPAFR